MQANGLATRLCGQLAEYSQMSTKYCVQMPKGPALESRGMGTFTKGLQEPRAGQYPLLQLVSSPAKSIQRFIMFLKLSDPISLGYFPLYFHYVCSLFSAP